MQAHLDAFMEAFIDKRFKSKRTMEPESKKAAQRRLRNEALGINPLLGMDNLWQALDKRYCTQLPSSGGNEVDFIRQRLARFQLQTCYILSAYPPWHQRIMSVEQALTTIVGSTSTTIISFIPGQVAYFEGHSVGDRWLCIREERKLDNRP